MEYILSLSNLICFSSNLLPMPSISLNFSCIQYFLGLFSLAGSDGLLSRLLLIREGEFLAVTDHVHPPLEWHKPIFTTSPTHCCDMRLSLTGPTNPLSRCLGSHPARLYPAAPGCGLGSYPSSQPGGDLPSSPLSPVVDTVAWLPSIWT